MMALDTLRALSVAAVFALAFMSHTPGALAQQHYGVKTTLVDDVVWAYRDKGKGPVAVLLHPYIGDSTLWLDQINGLKDVRRIIAPDLRGFGMSEPVTDQHIDSKRLSSDLITFLDAIGVKGKVDLVALSGSGLLAGLFYEKAPDRVASMTLMSTAFDWTLDAAYQRYQADLARLVVVEGKEPVFRRFDEYIRGNGASLAARARYKTMLLNMRSEMIVATLTNMKLAVPRPDLPAKIKVPVLFPIGTQDSVITDDRVNKIKGDFPDARVAQIQSAGRLLPLEAPEKLNEILRTFWTGAAKR
jgi:pimeloyl-ACP methyl ester carboxylesterase